MRRLLAIAGSLALVSCAAILGIDDGKPRADDAGVEAAADDSAAIDGGAEAEAGPPRSCDVTTAFGAPVPIAELSTTSTEAHARLTPDELTIYFQSDRSGGLGKQDIWMATRPTRSAPFGAPTDLTAVNGLNQDQDPTLPADGLTLYFSTNRSGGGDIWSAAAEDGGFGAPIKVPGINSSVPDFAPYVLPDGTRLYFATDRGSGDAGLSGVYVAALGDGGPGAPSSVQGSSGSKSNDAFPVVSADDLIMYLGSDRPASVAQGKFDIWVQTRASAGASFSPATDVTEVNSASDDHPSWISPDLCRLYLTSNRGGNYDIYVAERAPP